MQETFRYSQPLTSAEFGTLLFDICRKGVYKNPKIVITGSTIYVYGGTYLIYDNREDSSSGHAKNYAVRVANFSSEGDTSSDNPLTLNIGPEAQEGNVLVISYSYSSTSSSTAILALLENMTAVNSQIDNGNGVVILGTLKRDTSNAWFIDTSSQELIGTNATYPAPYISDFDYNVRTGSLSFNVTNYVQSNKHDSGSSGASASIAMTGIKNFSNISVDKGYYFYVDEQGVVQSADISIPVLGKNILAYKLEGETSFHFIRYRERAELTAKSFEVAAPSSYIGFSDTTDSSGYGSTVTEKTLYDRSKDSSGQIVLENLIYQMTKKIQSLQNQISILEKKYNASVNSKLSYNSDTDTLSVLAQNFNCVKGTIPTLTSTEATITTLHVTNFGTESDPIENVNVSGTVYVNNFNYNE